MNIFNDTNKYKEITGKQLNELNNNEPFYKFINAHKCHNRLNYDLGEIVDRIMFNPTSTCQKGGIYFSTLNCIFELVNTDDTDPKVC